MAELPDKDKLLRNFDVAPTGKKSISILLSWGRLPPLSEAAHNPDNIIQGCQSGVDCDGAKGDGTIGARRQRCRDCERAYRRGLYSLLPRCPHRILSLMCARGLKKWP